MYTHGIGNRMSWPGSPEPQNENLKGKGGGKEEDEPRKKRKVDKPRGGKASGSGGRQGDYQQSHHPNKFLNMQPDMPTAHGTSDTMITPTNLPAGPCSRWKKSKLVTVEPC